MQCNCPLGSLQPARESLHEVALEGSFERCIPK